MTQPDTTPDMPCSLITGTTGDEFTEEYDLIGCSTHSTRALGASGSAEELAATFYCDKGRDWRFLVRKTHEPGPMQTSLSGLAVEIYLDAMRNFHALGLELPPSLVIRRWVDDDTLEPLTLEHPASYDDVQWEATEPGTLTAYPVFQVVGADGTVYLRHTVRLERTES
jgi:hypothetical protein